MSDDKTDLTIRLPNGNKFEITMAQKFETITVQGLKEHLATLEDTKKCAAANQRIIYKGRILDDDRTLSDYGVVNKATVFLVMKSGNQPKQSAPAAATTTARATPPTATANTGNSGQPQTPSMFPPAGQGNNPFGSGQASNPFASAFGGGGGMPGMPQDPSAVLNNPMIQNMLDNNPDFIRNMMRSQLENNPALQQLMDSNPAIRHMLDDPAAFDQMMQMMRNPAAMQQAMRHQDLALSQLENMPGGFAALSNMYNTMQRPLEESFEEARSSSTETTSNRAASDSGAGASGAAMPNPWGSPSASATSASSNQSTSTNANSGSNSMANNPLASMFGGNMNGMDPMSMMQGGMMGPGAGASMEQRQAAMQMLQGNPAMLNMMQQAVRANPGMFRQMMTQQDPMAAMMFQNMTDDQVADFITNMMNPDNMNRMMQMEQQLRGMNVGGGGNANAGFNPWASGGSGSASAASPFGSAGAPPAFPTGLDFSSLFQPQQQQRQQQSNMNPADRYRVQLRSLYDMGFDDEVRNIAALQAVHGNLNRAVDMLLSGDVPMSNNASSGNDEAPSNSRNEAASASSPSTSENDNEQPSQPPKDADDKKND